MAVDRDRLVAIAEKHRDAWAEELRYRLTAALYNDATNWLSYSMLDDDITDEDFLQICQMMEMSVEFKPTKVEDIT